MAQVASNNDSNEESSRRWWPEVFPGVGDLVLQFVRYFILLDALIPISLYVTLELVKLVQCLFLAWDRQLYCAVSDLPFMYKTTTLNEVTLLCALIPERLIQHLSLMVTASHDIYLPIGENAWMILAWRHVPSLVGSEGLKCSR